VIFDSGTFRCYIVAVDTSDPAAARYELKDVADRAGVTPRTVHFYIQQGLLPPAGSPGPGARYSEAFLARLVLIRRLQREHRPLAEIRQRLAGLDDRALIELVTATSKDGGNAAPEKTSAIEYVRSVLGQSPPRSTGASPPPSAPPAASRTSWLRGLTSPLHALRVTHDEPPAFDLAPAAAAPSPSAPPAPAVPARSQWDRIVLAPDVELHIRRPLTREQNKRVERLLVAARQILQEDDV
jgi:DNA-binding transcriptional MerR regulator